MHNLIENLMLIISSSEIFSLSIYLTFFNLPRPAATATAATATA